MAGLIISSWRLAVEILRITWITCMLYELCLAETGLCFCLPKEGLVGKGHSVSFFWYVIVWKIQSTKTVDSGAWPKLPVGFRRHIKRRFAGAVVVRQDLLLCGRINLHIFCRGVNIVTVLLIHTSSDIKHWYFVSHGLT